MYLRCFHRLRSGKNAENMVNSYQEAMNIMADKKSRTDAQKKASTKWEEKYKHRVIRVPHEKDAALIKHAEELGESVNTLINRLIDQELSR